MIPNKFMVLVLTLFLHSAVALFAEKRGIQIHNLVNM